MQTPKRFPVKQNPKPSVLIVACFDARFKEATDRFPFDVLNLQEEEFILTKPGGGPTPLAYSEKTPNRCKYLTKQIMFSCNKFPSIGEVVLVSHGGKCGYYDTIPHYHYRDGVEEEDLALGGSLIKMVLPDYKITLYNAALVSGGKETEFREISISEKLVFPPFDWKKSYKLAHSH